MKNLIAAIAYSHKDAEAAARLLAYLRYKKCKAPLFIFCTKIADKLLITRKIRKWHTVHVVPDENELGWPVSATHLFVRTLQATDKDVLWVEPDCVPLTDDWFERINSEWENCSKPFMGNQVDANASTPAHMTGTAIYGSNWRKYCPELESSIVRDATHCGAWDVDCRENLLKNYQRTYLIQHFWHRFDITKELPVDPRAVLFHQCKTGSLMYQRDPDFFSSSEYLTFFPKLTITNRMLKFYQVANARIPLKVAGRTFQFEQTEMLGGSVWGTYKTSDAEEIRLLDSMVMVGRVYELTDDEFAIQEDKKKVRQQVSNVIVFPQSSMQIPRPKANVEPAVVVKEESIKPKPLRVKKQTAV
jgi:hypothetical protein